MKTIDKFVLKAYLGPMILTFLIVMFVLIMNFLWLFIDDLVGKGLTFAVIMELLMYGSISLIPMGLPLATLFATIMTMGNLGENYELLAMKASGMSLPRIMLPITIVVFFVAIGSFFVANDLVPYSTRQMKALKYDIRNKQQSLEFKEGVFVNGGSDNLAIRVEKQDDNTGLLTNVLIYDTKDAAGNMNATVADSGYIKFSDDKENLIITLYKGVLYQQTRDGKWYDKSELKVNFFNEQRSMIPMEGFNLERTDADLFTGSDTKNMKDIERGIDSLSTIARDNSLRSYQPLLTTNLFVYEPNIMIDSLQDKVVRLSSFDLSPEFGKLELEERCRVWESALNSAKNSRGMSSFEERVSKDALNQLYRYKNEWHRKLSLPVSIMIFFLIGAPLGAIIRKGGLGMPIVVSVVFFVIYYVISLSGEKMAKEGTWSSFAGIWLSTFILTPIAVFLTYKATHDSNLFNPEWYTNKYKKAKQYLITKFNKQS